MAYKDKDKQTAGELKSNELNRVALPGDDDFIADGFIKMPDTEMFKGCTYKAKPSMPSCVAGGCLRA